MKKAPEGAPTQGKDKYLNQLKQTQIAFYREPVTMKQVTVTTGIVREHICRYVKTLKKANAIWLIRIGKCPITGHPRVQFLTTDPKYAANLPKQLSLF